MKVNVVNFGSKHRLPANHQEMENKAYAEIYKRIMAGENGPFRVDYYHGKEPKIVNISEKKQGFFNIIKNTFKRIFKK